MYFSTPPGQTERFLIAFLRKKPSAIAATALQSGTSCLASSHPLRGVVVHARAVSLSKRRTRKAPAQTKLARATSRCRQTRSRFLRNALPDPRQAQKWCDQKGVRSALILGSSTKPRHGSRKWAFFLGLKEHEKLKIHKP